MANKKEPTKNPKTKESIPKSTAENQVAEDFSNFPAKEHPTKYFSNSTKDSPENTAENTTNQSQANKKFLVRNGSTIQNPIEHLLDMSIALKEITWNDSNMDENTGMAILLDLISEQIYTSASFLESLDLDIPDYKIEMREHIKE